LVWICFIKCWSSWRWYCLFNLAVSRAVILLGIFGALLLSLSLKVADTRLISDQQRSDKQTFWAVNPCNNFSVAFICGYLCCFRFQSRTIVLWSLTLSYLTRRGESLTTSRRCQCDGIFQTRRRPPLLNKTKRARKGIKRDLMVSCYPVWLLCVSLAYTIIF